MTTAPASLTARGAVFWPVGTGDSTTLVVSDEIVVQVDIHDLEKAAQDDTPETAVVERLMEALPERDGRPYLSVFALTHADKDHCNNFEDLLSEVTIGEIWATPRLWREYEEAQGEGLCQSAQAFHDEAERRVQATREAQARGEAPGSGDRIRIIGHDTDRDLHGYTDLPDDCLSFPGDIITTLDGNDCTGTFEAFVHAPFKDDCAEERNDTSLALHVTLTDGTGAGRFLLLGDLAHDTIVKIFDWSIAAENTAYVEWDVLLAPHHCSKKVMYDGDVLLDDVLLHLDTHGAAERYVVSSSNVLRDDDPVGANPPHRLAAERYQEIADQFLVTMQHGSTETPAPVVFEVDPAGLTLLDAQVVTKSFEEKSLLASAVGQKSRLVKVAAAATRHGQKLQQERHVMSPAVSRLRDTIAQDRGGNQAPAEAVGFGSQCQDT